jgi:hypothetical protein
MRLLFKETDDGRVKVDPEKRDDLWLRCIARIGEFYLVPAADAKFEQEHGRKPTDDVADKEAISTIVTEMWKEGCADGRQLDMRIVHVCQDAIKEALREGQHKQGKKKVKRTESIAVEPATREIEVDGELRTIEVQKFEEREVEKEVDNIVEERRLSAKAGDYKIRADDRCHPDFITETTHDLDALFDAIGQLPDAERGIALLMIGRDATGTIIKEEPFISFRQMGGLATRQAVEDYLRENEPDGPSKSTIQRTYKKALVSLRRLMTKKKPAPVAVMEPPPPPVEQPWSGFAYERRLQNPQSPVRKLAA